MPDTHIFAPGDSYGRDIIKAADLDRDRTTVLTPELADLFVSTVNAILTQPKAREMLTDDRAHALAESITQNHHFPFTAEVQDNVVVLASALNKINRPLVLKDISNGFTEAHKVAVKGESEGFKVALSQLIYPAIDHVYRSAGVPGCHTPYTLRGC